MGTKERYLGTSGLLSEVCDKAGRDPGSVKLVAVSKTVGAADVECAIQAGAADFGENRPDQLVVKSEAFPQVRWHFIGNIQSRRLRDIVGRATLIHSVHEQSHARKIDELASGLGITQDVLLEVNVSGEQSKSGLAPDEVRAMMDACGQLEHVRVLGLMTMAPRGDEDAARTTFRGLSELKAELSASLPARQAECFTELSMGMSEDWPIAVQEGATLVRIGRAIFSDEF